MPRYFFNTTNGTHERDDAGMELPDHSAARKAAIRFAGTIMDNEPSVLWDGSEFLVQVTDQNETLLFTIIAHAVNAPAAGDVE